MVIWETINMTWLQISIKYWAALELFALENQGQTNVFQHPFQQYI